MAGQESVIHQSSQALNLLKTSRFLQLINFLLFAACLSLKQDENKWKLFFSFSRAQSSHTREILKNFQVSLICRKLFDFFHDEELKNSKNKHKIAAAHTRKTHSTKNGNIFVRTPKLYVICFQTPSARYSTKEDTEGRRRTE